MKYHLGCGSNYLEGYINVDFSSDNHNVNFDIKADLYTDILTMDYQPCLEIRSHHFFEHFNYFETLALLFKWTNALQLGGKLIIDLPDMEELCKAYLFHQGKTQFLVARYIFGSHEADWAYHINSWSENTLRLILEDIGYKIIDVKKYGNYMDMQPNCGFTVEASLDQNWNKEELIEKLIKYFKWYQNGETKFENSLGKYFTTEFIKLIGKNDNI